MMGCSSGHSFHYGTGGMFLQLWTCYELRGHSIMAHENIKSEKPGHARMTT